MSLQMYNQNWHVVPFGGHQVSRMQGDITPDTQLTDPWMVIFRRDFKPAGEPGPEIVIYCYAAYNDPNGEREDGSMPDIIAEAQVGYEIREADGNVNDADYEYVSSDVSYPDVETADSAARTMAYSYVGLGDLGWDWNGESAMCRAGGPV